MTEVTTEQLFHRLGTLETAIEAQTKAMDAYTSSNESRLGVIEQKLDRPFPWIQLLGTIFAGLVVVGAIFSASLQPLFTDTERNRLALLTSQQQMSAFNEVVADFRNLENRVQDQRSWNQSLSDRQRLANERSVASEARSLEYQRESEKDRDTIRIKVDDALSRLAAHDAKIDHLKDWLNTIDTNGSRKWVGRDTDSRE